MSGSVSGPLQLLVLGGGGHGCVVVEAAEAGGAFERVVVVDRAAAGGWDFPAAACVASEEEIGALPGEWRFVVAIGDPAVRRRLFESYAGRGFRPANVIHPRAIVSPSARLGSGIMILAGAVVATRAEIGDGVIVNHNAVVEHDCRVAGFAHVGPGSVLAGGASIGDASFLGAAASVRHGLSIGAGVIIGNGAAVAAPIERPGTYVGVPARPLDQNS